MRRVFHQRKHWANNGLPVLLIFVMQQRRFFLMGVAKQRPPVAITTAGLIHGRTNQDCYWPTCCDDWTLLLKKDRVKKPAESRPLTDGDQEAFHELYLKYPELLEATSALAAYSIISSS